MTVQISPLSALPETLLIEYMLGRGNPEPLTRWKYLDAAFNRGRERGFAAVRDGKMIGFIGLLPVTIRKGDERRGYVWMFDWSIADVKGDKGVGGQMLRAALDANGNVLGRGGTRLARKSLNRKLDHYDLDACAAYARILTLAPFLRGLRSRGLYPRPLPIAIFDRFSRARWRRPRREFMWHEGVHPSLPELMADNGAVGWWPEFNLSDLRWQIDDCPDVRGWTCVSETERVAVLAWTSTRSPQSWKLVPIGRGDRQHALRRCLAEALRNVVRLGGQTAAVLISRLDTDLAATLEYAGFRRGKTPEPIGVFNANSEGAPKILERLSLLDSDEAHRF